MRKLLFLSFIMLLFTSCMSNKEVSRLSVLGETISYSLFTDKDASISEGNIQKVLEGTLALPQKLRIAVVDLNNVQNRYYGGGDSDYMLMQQTYMDTIISGLKQNSRTESALLVPKMVLTSTNFTAIREAAVRMQTDLVLVYAINVGSSKYKKEDAKGYRATANTQLMAIDVRTGLVPFSSVVTKDYFVKNVNEKNKGENVRRAQEYATLQSLDKVNKEINEFLSKK